MLREGKDGEIVNKLGEKERKGGRGRRETGEEMGLMDKKGTEGRSRSFMRVLLKEGEDTEKLKRKSDRNEKKRKERRERKGKR